MLSLKPVLATYPSIFQLSNFNCHYLLFHCSLIFFRAGNACVYAFCFVLKNPLSIILEVFLEEAAVDICVQSAMLSESPLCCFTFAYLSLYERLVLVFNIIKGCVRSLGFPQFPLVKKPPLWLKNREGELTYTTIILFSAVLLSFNIHKVT